MSYSLWCSGINKPVAVMDWLRKVQPQEDYILILDADMIMLKPFDPVKMGVLPGVFRMCCTSRVHAPMACAAAKHTLPEHRAAGQPAELNCWLSCRLGSVGILRVSPRRKQRAGREACAACGAAQRLPGRPCRQAWGPGGHAVASAST